MLRHEQAKKLRFFPDPILWKELIMKEYNSLNNSIVLLESILYCLWKFFSQSFWEEDCEHSGQRGNHSHDEDGSRTPVHLLE